MSRTHRTPGTVLGEFRKWLREQYLPKRLPMYLVQKVKQGDLPPARATAALEAFKPVKLLPAKV